MGSGGRLEAAAARANALSLGATRALVLVLTLGLTAIVARAEPQYPLVMATIDTFTRAAAALETGDSQAADQLLARMAALAASLRASAERLRAQAETGRAACEKRSLAVVAEISQTYAEEKALDHDVQTLAAQQADLNAQHAKLASDAAVLEAQMVPLRAEAQVRKRCAESVAGWFENFGTCMSLGFQDLFERRVDHLNNEARDLQRRRQELRAQAAALDQRLAARRAEKAQKERRARDLAAHRQRLEGQDRALRAAVTSLSDITVFWGRAESLAAVRVGSRVAVLKDLLPLLDQTSNRPVFDAYDREEIRSLRTTMLDFSRTLDAGTNFLLSPAICS
jgi:hypothetical protein